VFGAVRVGVARAFVVLAESIAGSCWARSPQEASSHGWRRPPEQTDRSGVSLRPARTTGWQPNGSTIPCCRSIPSC